MKTLIISLLLLCTTSLNAQYFAPQPDNSAKSNYKFILVYREWEQGYKQYGDAMSITHEWKDKFVGFNSKKEVIAWLNDTDYVGHKTARIAENNFIALYDLSEGQKIPLKFKKEDKTKVERVEYNKVTWTDTTVDF